MKFLRMLFIFQPHHLFEKLSKYFQPPSLRRNHSNHVKLIGSNRLFLKVVLLQQPSFNNTMNFFRNIFRSTANHKIQIGLKIY